MIDSKTHGIIDYIHAGTNILAGFLFRNRNRRASNACFALGAILFAGSAAANAVQPYGWNDAGGFRNVLPPGENGLGCMS